MKYIKKYNEKFIPLSLKENFNSIKEMWWSETKNISIPSEKYKNKYYQEIINFGKNIIPYLLEDLDTPNGDWIYALNKITGENPVKSENIGQFHKMKQDWINWSKNRKELSVI